MSLYDNIVRVVRGYFMIDTGGLLRVAGRFWLRDVEYSGNNFTMGAFAQHHVWTGGSGFTLTFPTISAPTDNYANTGWIKNEGTGEVTVAAPAGTAIRMGGTAYASIKLAPGEGIQYHVRWAPDLAEWICTWMGGPRPGNGDGCPGSPVIWSGAGDVVNAINATAPTTLAGVANRVDLGLFIPSRSFTTTAVGVDCTTGVAAANVKVLVYKADEVTGLPTDLLFTSAAIAVTSAGVKTAAATFSFVAGRQYWVGVVHSSTATIRAVPPAATPTYGVDPAASTALLNCVRPNGSYATPSNPPTSFTYLSGTNVPLIRMRPA